MAKSPKTRETKVSVALAATIAVITSGFSAASAPLASAAEQHEPGQSAAPDRPADYECSAATDHYQVQEVSPSDGASAAGGGSELSASVTITNNNGSETTASSAGIGLSTSDGKDRVLVQIAQVPGGGVWGAEAYLFIISEGHPEQRRNIARIDWGHTVRLSLRIDSDGLETVFVDKAKRVNKGPLMAGRLSAILICSSSGASFKDVKYVAP